MNLVCLVYERCTSGGGLGLRLCLRGVRGSGGRRVRRTRLHFFAGVSRSFEAPLSLVVTTLSGLQQRNLGRCCCQVLGNGTRHLLGLIGRLVSFEAMRGNVVGLRLRPLSVGRVIGRVTGSFVSCTRRHGVSFRIVYSARLPIAVCTSEGVIRGVIVGLLGGTFGCAPSGKGVLLRAENQGSYFASRCGGGFVINRYISSAFFVLIDSAKINISRSSVDDIFSEFCGIGAMGASSRLKAKVKLTLIGDLMLLRGNDVSVFDREKQNASVIIHLPLSDNVFGRSSFVERRRAETRRVVQASSRRVTASIRVGKVRSRLLRSAGGGVLVVRSGRSLEVLVTRSLSSRFRMVRTNSKIRTLGLVRRASFSLVVDSVVVPGGSNVSLYGSVGKSVGASRVPIVLLATGADLRDGVRKISSNTSLCFRGPISLACLGLSVRGVFEGQQRLGRRCTGGCCTSDYRLSSGRRSGGFLGRFVTFVRTGVSRSRVSVGRVTKRLSVDEDGLCAGIGDLAKGSMIRFILGYHLHGTTGLVVRRGVAVERIVVRVNVRDRTCFAGSFGGMFNRAPATFTTGRGGAAHWVGQVGWVTVEMDCRGNRVTVFTWALGGVVW